MTDERAIKAAKELADVFNASRYVEQKAVEIIERHYRAATTTESRDLATFIAEELFDTNLSAISAIADMIRPILDKWAATKAETSHDALLLIADNVIKELRQCQGMGELAFSRSLIADAIGGATKAETCPTCGEPWQMADVEASNWQMHPKYCPNAWHSPAPAPQQPTIEVSAEQVGHFKSVIGTDKIVGAPVPAVTSEEESGNA
jgi:hypothetical protein